MGIAVGAGEPRPAEGSAGTSSVPPVHGTLPVQDKLEGKERKVPELGVTTREKPDLAVTRGRRGKLPQWCSVEAPAAAPLQAPPAQGAPAQGLYVPGEQGRASLDRTGRSRPASPLGGLSHSHLGGRARQPGPLLTSPLAAALELRWWPSRVSPGWPGLEVTTRNHTHSGLAWLQKPWRSRHRCGCRLLLGLF